MKYLIIAILVITPLEASAQNDCAGRGCSNFMAPIGDGSALDKSVAICNLHKNGFKWDDDFPFCVQVKERWNTSKAAQKTKEESDKREQDKSFLSGFIK